MPCAYGDTILTCGEITYQACGLNKKFDKSKLVEFFGRSDRIRTCGIDVPNVARYQLRHTP